MINMAQFSRPCQFSIAGIIVVLGLVVGCGKWPPVVENARDVERLSIDEASVRARGLADEHIHSLERLKNLKHLDFTSGMAVIPARISDEGLKILASLDLPRLDSIHLGYNSTITDRGIGYLAAMGPLEMLALFDCPKITDSALAGLAGGASIANLLLDGCSGITDKGVLELVNLRGLEWLSLDGCPNVSTEAVLALQQALPNVKIGKNDEAWESLNRNR